MNMQKYFESTGVRNISPIRDERRLLCLQPFHVYSNKSKNDAILNVENV